MITEARIATTDGSILNVERDNITLSGLQTLQAVSLVAGDVVLITGQVDGTQNGPYVVASGAWSRHPDHDTGAEFVRPWEIFIREGSYANWRFQFTNPATPTLGTSVINFEPFARDEVERAGANLLENTPGIFDLANSGAIAGSFDIGPVTLDIDAKGIISGLGAGYGQRVYIEGFIPTWVTAGGLPIFTAGAAWVDGSENVLEIAIDANGPTDSLTAASFMYFYLQPSISGPNIRGTATAPDVAYLGTARNMTGDANTRYICALRTNAAGTAFYNFQAQMLSDKRLLIAYLEDTTVSPFRAVSGGTATTNQTVNLGPSGLKLVPPTCRSVLARVSVNATSGVWIDNSEMTTSPAAATGEHVVTSNERAQHVWISLDASQAFRWANVAAGGSTTVDIKKYLDRR